MYACDVCVGGDGDGDVCVMSTMGLMVRAMIQRTIVLLQMQIVLGYSAGFREDSVLLRFSVR